MEGHCAICAHYTRRLTKHHALFPKRKFVNHPLREKLIIFICWPCHQMINDHFFRRDCRYVQP